MKVLSVTVHPIDGKTARANNFPQKSKVCVFVLERYTSERSESPQVHWTTKKNRYLLTGAHKKTADDELGYLHRRAQVLLTTA